VVLAGRPACGPYGSVRHSSPGTNRYRRGGSPARGFISALCKGGGIHAQHGWWVSSPQGCVFLRKHLPVANGLLWFHSSWVVVEAPWAAGMGLPAASPYGVGVRDPWFWRAAGCAAPTDPCGPAVPLFTLHSSLCPAFSYFFSRLHFSASMARANMSTWRASPGSAISST
jgi:hypothetical protein